MNNNVPHEPQIISAVQLKPDCDIGVLNAGVAVRVEDGRLIFFIGCSMARESVLGNVRIHNVPMRVIGSIPVDEVIQMFERAETPPAPLTVV